jgi:tetratricopeptide (TPR) repeat protein
VDLLSNFFWGHARRQEAPKVFADVGGDLLWRLCPPVVRALDRWSVAPLEQAETLLDELEAEAIGKAAGVRPAEVLRLRFHHAWMTGQVAKAQAFRHDLDEPLGGKLRDWGEIGEAALFYAEAGQMGKALPLARGLVDALRATGAGSRQVGTRGLALAASAVALLLLKNGLLDEAETAHIRSYAVARQDPRHIDQVAEGIIFCAVSGNEARAFEMVERHIRWLAADAMDEWGRLQLLGAAELALYAADRLGWGLRPVIGSDAPDVTGVLELAEPFGPLTAARLLPKVRRAADSMAAAFDGRNGNGRASERLRASRDLADRLYHLPLAANILVGLPPEPETPNWAPPLDVTDPPSPAKRPKPLRLSAGAPSGAGGVRAAAVVHDAAGPAPGSGPDFASASWQVLEPARWAAYAAARRQAGLESAGRSELEDAALAFRQAARAAAVAGDRTEQRAAQFLAAQVFWVMGDSLAAADWFADVAEAERALGLAPQWEAETQEWLSLAYQSAGDAADAWEALGQALRGYSEAGLLSDVARTHWLRGRLAAEGGLAREAMSEFDQAMAVLGRCGPGDDPAWRDLALDILDDRARAQAARGDSSAHRDLAEGWRQPPRSAHRPVELRPTGERSASA